MTNNYLILYACCIPVRGYHQSIIYDLQNLNYKIIPNELYDFINENNSIIDILNYKNNISESESKIFDNIVLWLLDNNLAFYSDSPLLFEKISYTYNTPSIITNMILCMGAVNKQYINEIITFSDNVLLQALELRFGYNISLSSVIEILDYFNNSSVEAIEIIIFSIDKLTCEEIEYISKIYGRIKRITIYNMDKYIKKVYSDLVVEFIDDDYNLDRCGIIVHSSLIFSLPFFIESHNYNSCLNKKVCIDFNGNIKKCHASESILGHVSNLPLFLENNRETLTNKITKNMIEICKICEFRFACLDCREFTDNNLKKSRPSKCQYNPFIAKWHNEKGYVSVHEMGEYDVEGCFVLNK